LPLLAESLLSSQAVSTVNATNNVKTIFFITFII